MANQITLTLGDLDIEEMEVRIDASAVLAEMDADDIASACGLGTLQEIVGGYITDLDATELRSLLRDCGHESLALPRWPSIEFCGTRLPHVTSIEVNEETVGIVVVCADGVYFRLWSGSRDETRLVRTETECEAHRMARWLILGRFFDRAEVA